MEENKPIGVDASGFEILTNAVLDLLSQFPGLNGREILFEELGKESGIAFSADNGALIMTERRSITDHVTQTCQYPFFIVYRTASTKEYQKLQVQAFFDAIGKWLCKVAKQEIRLDPNIHWWTFFGWFMGIGDGVLASVLHIRQKKAKGKKLEKWEQEFYRENKALCDIQKRCTAEEIAERENIMKWL